MKTLREILTENIGADYYYDGISDRCLFAEVEDYNIIKHNNEVFDVQVRFDGWDKEQTHPSLRNPRTDGWFTYEFENYDGKWYFYCCRS